MKSMTLEESLTSLRAHLLNRLQTKWGWEEEDAEDILQDAWIRLATGEPPPDGDWEPYIKQAVKSISINKAETEKNRSHLHEKRWGKIVKGFNLLEKPEVIHTHHPPADEIIFEEKADLDT